MPRTLCWASGCPVVQAGQQCVRKHVLPNGFSITVPFLWTWLLLCSVSIKVFCPGGHTCVKPLWPTPGPGSHLTATCSIVAHLRWAAQYWSATQSGPTHPAPSSLACLSAAQAFSTVCCGLDHRVHLENPLPRSPRAVSSLCNCLTVLFVYMLSVWQMESWWHFRSAQCLMHIILRDKRQFVSFSSKQVSWQQNL